VPHPRRVSPRRLFAARVGSQSRRLFCWTCIFVSYYEILVEAEGPDANSGPFVYARIASRPLPEGAGAFRPRMQLRFVTRARLQSCRKRPKNDWALAPEVRLSGPSPKCRPFSAACSVVPQRPPRTRGLSLCGSAARGPSDPMSVHLQSPGLQAPDASAAFKSPNGTKRPFVSREPLAAKSAFIGTESYGYVILPNSGARCGSSLYSEGHLGRWPRSRRAGGLPAGRAASISGTD
jgi:hypothetical protein